MAALRHGDFLFEIWAESVYDDVSGAIFTWRYMSGLAT